jgi:hypothetical protein
MSFQILIPLLAYLGIVVKFDIINPGCMLAILVFLVASCIHGNLHNDYYDSHYSNEHKLSNKKAEFYALCIWIPFTVMISNFIWKTV